MSRTAMILAAGLGTRLKALTHDKPKALVEVAGKPLLQRNIENLTDQGFDTIIVNIHHFGDQIIDFIQQHHFNAKILISDERGALMDTGGGIVQALPYFGDSHAVLVHNVDILSDIDLQTYHDGFVSSNDDAWLLTQDRNTSRKLLFDEQDLLIGWKNL
ncbi:MAG: NTP transferase domain-containing protein, partial [Bacteroidales bacterium]|nr:NTP transferase domain-containing protein [Bacteroidales bacterium]